MILTATGSFRGAQKGIQVVIRRDGVGSAPDFPAAVNEPGFQSDTYVACANNGGSCANFRVDGRDYACSTCTTTNDAAW